MPTSKKPMEVVVTVQHFIDQNSHLPQVEQLIQDRLGLTLIDLLLRGDQMIQPMRLPQLIHDCRRLESGEPLAYILGQTEFYGRQFTVSYDTLIPRPDTEHLVDLALKLGDQIQPAGGSSLRVCDLGTGSGCLAVSVALERPDWSVCASDLSEAALKVARQNANRLNALVEFTRSDWFEAFEPDQRFDLILSNPPYIDEADEHLQALAHEPMSALIAADSGLGDIEQLISQAPQFLSQQGWLLIEHGFDQGAAVRALFESNFEQIVTHIDYGQNERVTYGRLKLAKQRG